MQEKEQEKKETPLIEGDKEEPVKRGRGRPKKEINGASGMYFDTVEKYLVEYMGETNMERRNYIFNSYIYKPIYFMAQTILNKYYFNNPKFMHLNPVIGESNEDMIYDAISFLLTKFDYFKPERGYKAYSYLQSIIKHYYGARYKEAYKKSCTYMNLDSSYENHAQSSYTMTTDETTTSEDVVKLTIKNIEKAIKEQSEELELTDEDIQVGYCLMDALIEYDKHLGGIGTSDKCNKASLLYFINDRLFMEIKNIRNSLKKYKNIYEDARIEILKKI
jgi:hypothetical protein